MYADTPPQVYIILAKLAILLTVELFCICYVITLKASKQNWESTVTGNLETAIDNVCLPLYHHIVLIDKTTKKWGASSYFKDRVKVAWYGLSPELFKNLYCWFVMGNDQ